MSDVEIMMMVGKKMYPHFWERFPTEKDYIADMAKYAIPQESARIRAVWESIPSQLAKENRKFQYKVVKKGGRAAQYENALFWLQTAGLINWCVRVDSGYTPLSMQEDKDSFKKYLLDTGLLSVTTGLTPAMLFDGDELRLLDAGAIAENYVAQQLNAFGHNLYYWTSSGKAELDFILEDGTVNPVPVEVKSGSNVRSKSLSVYTAKYPTRYTIRFSAKNFGFDGHTKSVPLYAAFCAAEQLKGGKLLAIQHNPYV